MIIINKRLFFKNLIEKSHSFSEWNKDITSCNTEKYYIYLRININEVVIFQRPEEDTDIFIYCTKNGPINIKTNKYLISYYKFKINGFKISNHNIIFNKL